MPRVRDSRGRMLRDLCLMSFCRNNISVPHSTALDESGFRLRRSDVANTASFSRTTATSEYRDGLSAAATAQGRRASNSTDLLSTSSEENAATGSGGACQGYGICTCRSGYTPTIYRHRYRNKIRDCQRACCQCSCFGHQRMPVRSLPEPATCRTGKTGRRRFSNERCFAAAESFNVVAIDSGFP